MYGALWRLLPGSRWLKTLQLCILGAVVLFVLAFWVFPWIDSLLAPPVTVGEMFDPRERHSHSEADV